MSRRNGRKSATTVRPDGTNDHFIPKFVLRGFQDRSSANPSNFTINRVELEAGRIERRAVRYTASVAGLYDAPKMDAAGTRLERIYHRVESHAAPHIKRLIAGDLNLSPSERKAVARLIAYQGSRTVTYRRNLDAMFQVTQAEIGKYFLSRARQHSRLAEVFIAAHIAARRVPQGDGDFVALQSLTTAAEVTPVLIAMDWIVIEAPAGSEFILGDQPVVSVRDAEVPADAAEAVGTFTQMPLSPTRLLWMRRPADSNAVGELRSHIATADEVESYNRLSLGRSARYVFTRNWELAEWAVQYRNDDQPIHLPDGTVVEPLRRVRSTPA